MKVVIETSLNFQVTRIDSGRVTKYRVVEQDAIYPPIAFTNPNEAIEWMMQRFIATDLTVSEAFVMADIVMEKQDFEYAT